MRQPFGCVSRGKVWRVHRLHGVPARLAGCGERAGLRESACDADG